MSYFWIWACGPTAEQVQADFNREEAAANNTIQGVALERVADTGLQATKLLPCQPCEASRWQPWLPVGEDEAEAFETMKRYDILPSSGQPVMGFQRVARYHIG